MKTAERLLEIAGHFELGGTPGKVSRLGNGFINDTFVIEMSDSAVRYLLQRKNSRIFRDIPGMMNNILLITNHLKNKIIANGGDPERETLTVIPTKDGKLYLLDNDEYWCVTLFIEGSVTYERASSVSLTEKGGKGIGKFQSMLSDFSQPLTDTLPGFHNISFRFGQWDDTLKRDPVNRAAEVRHLIQEIDQRRDEISGFYKLIETGRIPKRVTHNDTKIANMLFDSEDNVLCVIDLDTVLQAPCLYDFGDSIRSYTNTGAEDDRNPDNVSMSMEMYEAFRRGYLSEANAFLTSTELEYLPYSAKYITYEQVLRFLMDYIDGDNYYKTAYPEHNLVRTVAQLRLLESIERQLSL